MKLALLLMALVVMSLFVFFSNTADSNEELVYFKTGFEADTSGFVIQYSSSRAGHEGPDSYNGESYSGEYSLYFKAWSISGKEECASFRTPIFRMSMSELWNYRYVAFWMKTWGHGRVKVVLWIRNKTAADDNIPFHIGGVAKDVVLEIRDNTSWYSYIVDVYSMVKEWNLHENVNEWYLEWYVYVEDRKGLVILLDDFIVANPDSIIIDGSNVRPNVEFKTFISADRATETSIIRVAVYIHNKEPGGLLNNFEAFITNARGVEVVKNESSHASMISSGMWGKYVLYLKITGKEEAVSFTLYARYLFGVHRYTQEIGSYTIRVNNTGPLLVVRKEVVKLNDYEAEITIKIKNIGNSEAKYVRIADLLPRGLYVSSGSTKVWLEKLVPNKEYVLEYRVMSYYDNIFSLPKARVIYYDSDLNEYWCWSNTITLYLKKAPENYTGVGVYGVRVFPERPTPVSPVYVIDLRQIPEIEVLATTFQGAVNKYKPCIFLIRDDDDVHWLKELVLQYGITYTYVDIVDAITLFKDYIKGYIVYDESLPETVNIATMLASAYDAIVVSPRDEYVARGLGFTKLFDLRGKWKTREEMYEWMIRNVLPMMSNRVIAFLHVKVPPPGWNRFDIMMRDYLISTRSAVLTLSPRYDGIPYTPYDWVLLEEIYDRYYPPVVIMGWWYDEYANVRRASERGFVVVASDLIPNLSILSAFKPLHILVQYHSEPSELKDNAVYVTILRSDGDNFCTNYHLMNGKGGNAWMSPNRGTVPYGWSIQPLGAELAPIVLQYLYQTATPNDYFFAGPSGAGYYYPQYIEAKYRFTKYSMDQYYGRLVDTPLYQVLGNPDNPAGILETEYVQYSGAKYLQHGYGAERAASEGIMYYFNGVCYLFTGVALSEGDSYTDVAMRVEELAARIGKRPLFIIIHTINWFTSYDDVVKLYNALTEKGFIVLHPEVFYKLYRKSRVGKTIDATVYQAYYPSLDGFENIIVSGNKYNVRKSIAIMIKEILMYARNIDNDTYNTVSMLVDKYIKEGDRLEIKLNKLMRAVLILNSTKKIAIETNKTRSLFRELKSLLNSGELDQLITLAEEELPQLAKVPPTKPHEKTKTTTTTTAIITTTTTTTTAIHSLTTTTHTTTTTTTTSTPPIPTIESPMTTILIMIILITIIVIASILLYKLYKR